MHPQVHVFILEKGNFNRMEPRIKVKFFLEGDEFSKEYIREKLGLEPTVFRTKKDWPEAILNWPVYNPNLPDKCKPRTVWELETGYEECMSVTHQLEKLIGKLKGKADTLNRLCRELDLCTSFTVVVEAEVGYFPVMCLEKEAVAFIANIGADIGFDLYVYDA